MMILVRDTKPPMACAPRLATTHFAWFGTTASKSRLNFLDLLRAGHSD